jgi:hypothetical protein
MTARREMMTGGAMALAASPMLAVQARSAPQRPASLWGEFVGALERSDAASCATDACFDNDDDPRWAAAYAALDELHSAIWRIIRAPISPTAFLDRVRLSLNLQGAGDLPTLDAASFHEEELLAQLVEDFGGAGGEGAGMTSAAVEPIHPNLVVCRSASGSPRFSEKRGLLSNASATISSRKLRTRCGLPPSARGAGSHSRTTSAFATNRTSGMR